MLGMVAMKFISPPFYGASTICKTLNNSRLNMAIFTDKAPNLGLPVINLLLVHVPIEENTFSPIMNAVEKLNQNYPSWNLIFK